jgi:UDP-N-acetylglucosamine:LPS N-acetylglucosamine transferase
MVAAGGQRHLMDLFPGEPRLQTWGFTPLQNLLCHAALLVCHGGQMTVFEALEQRVPVLVIPFQPEQAHNGVCLERMGCGRRLAPAVAFKGNADVYEKAFTAQPDPAVEETISGVAGNKDITAGLARAALSLGRYGGASALADLLVAR